MGRLPRPQIEDGIYHVTDRGNARAAIFVDGWDYKGFLRILGRMCAGFDVQVFAYCLMPNHYHLLVRTLHPNIAAAMRHLNGSYAQRFNSRYEREGHVFQGPYRARLIEDESHFHEGLRYIVVNPYAAGLCRALSQWPWSSYLATLGIERAPLWLCVAEVLDQFARDRARARELYAEFVADRIGLVDSARAAMAADLVRG